MRYFKAAFPLAVLLMLVMPSCKKGENDPAISLHTRKGRVAGEWKVTSGKGTSQYTPVNGTSTTTKWSMTRDSYTTTDQWGTATTQPRTIEYKFERDGTFTITDTENSEVTTIKGRWNFNDGTGDVKAKSQLVMFYTEVADNSGTSVWSGYKGTFVYDIDELRNKKMAWKYSNNATYPWSTKDFYNEEWTLEAK
jgi:opacity protein-like surface antigen